MKYTTVCAAFFAAVAAASDVKQLKTDNFKSFIEENDLVLAECKYTKMHTSCFQCQLLTFPRSLRAMVRPLQGARPRVRDGGYHT